MVFYDRFKLMHSMAERSVSGSLYQMLVVALGIGLPGREVYSQAFASYEQSVSVSHRSPGDLAERMEIVFDNLTAEEETVRVAAQNLSRSGMTQLASAAMQWLDGPRKRVPSDFGASPRVGYDASVQQQIGLGHGNESAFSLGAASGGSSGAPEGDEGYGVGPGYGMSQPNQPPYGPFHSPVPYSFSS